MTRTFKIWQRIAAALAITSGALYAAAFRDQAHAGTFGFVAALCMAACWVASVHPAGWWHR